MLNNNKTKCW